MRYNGYLKYRILPKSANEATDAWTAAEPDGAVFDEDGCPVAEVAEWSEPVECFIAINEFSLRHPTADEADGGCTRQSYELLTERMDLDTDRVQLSQHGRMIGEFEVVYIQQTVMDRTKIDVE